MNESASRPSFGPAHQFPMTFGQVFDRTFRLMRDNLRLLLGVAAVPSGAFFLILALVFAIVFAPILAQLPKQPDPTAFSHTFIPLIFLMSLLNGIVFALYLAASIHAAAQADLGAKITFRVAYGMAWKRCGRLRWVAISHLPHCLFSGASCGVGDLNPYGAVHCSLDDAPSCVLHLFSASDAVAFCCDDLRHHHVAAPLTGLSCIAG